MKKITAVLCAVMLAMVCLMAAGCGKAKYAGSEYLGKWKATKAAYSGIELGVEDILGGEFSLNLKDDGTCTVKVVDEEETGNWEETDKGVKLTDKKEELEFTKEDDALTVDYSGMTMYFEKE
ncbi:MAG: hypothetical protein II974_10470 [Firmicutes bacterium]|nr:hypothetical protein [Bacillota bacterium]